MSDSISNNIFGASTSSSATRPQHHEEESTTFRSIPLGSASAVSSLRMPAGLAPLSAGKRSLASMPTSFTKPTTASVVTSSSLSWKVDAASLPAMPDYPLERTHMTCAASLSLEQITQRIASVVESQSLRCDFPTPESSDLDEEIFAGRADCSTTADDLKFVIQLYQNNSEVVVEVQRRKGSAMAFSAIRKPLFQMLSTGMVTAKKAFSPPSTSMGDFVPNKKFRMMPPMTTSSLASLHMAAMTR